MNKLLIAIVALALGCLSLQGRQLTPRQALQCVKTDGVRAVRGIVDSTPQLVYTAQAEGLNTAYIFDSSNGGYLVLAADDAVPSLLGYSDAGSIDADRIPAPMRAWLDAISSEIAYAAATGAKAAPAAEDLAPVEPICKTMWGQDVPFNDLTPVVGGAQSPTGCVATALAQIMKHYNYPAQGTGKLTYRDSYYNKITADFGATTFAWTEMLDSYNDTYTPEQANAVAVLMKMCGAAARMSYGQNESGATTPDALQGLMTYLGYDKGAHLVERACYDRASWEEIIYNELTAGQPVLYGGSGAGGGHQFVCDGYDGHGYFHMNWGWDGTSDGYFILSLLNPSALGTGAGSGNFNVNQDAVVGLVPDKGTESIVPVVMVMGSLCTAADTYTRNATGKVKFDYYLLNYSAGTLDVTPGVKLVSGDDVQYAAAATSTSMAPASGMEGYRVPAMNFPVGEWKAYPAYQVNGEWHDMLLSYNAKQYLPLTVTEDTITVDNSAPNPNLDLSLSVSVPEPFYAADWCRFSATVTNHGRQFYGAIYPVLTSTSGRVYTATFQAVALDENASAELTFAADFTNSMNQNPSAGAYTLSFTDDMQQPVGEPVSVTVTSSPRLTVSGVEVSTAVSGAGTQSDPLIVPAEKADVTVSYTATGDCNVWSSVRLLTIDWTTGMGSLAFESPQYLMELQKGVLGSYTTTMDFSTVTPDIDYVLWPTPDSSQTLTCIRFKASGIDTVGSSVFSVKAVGHLLSVTAPTAIKTIEVYDIAGRLVSSAAPSATNAEMDLSALQSGNYIVRVSLADGAVKAKQIML